MPNEDDDTASNPFNEAHLPVAGESDTGTGLMGADIADDMHVSEPDDASDLSRETPERLT